MGNLMVALVVACLALLGAAPPSADFSPRIWMWLQGAIDGGHHVWIREQMRLNQVTVAAMVGCTPGALAHWEKGRRRPTLKMGMRYARVLLDLDAELQRRAVRRGE